MTPQFRMFDECGAATIMYAHSIRLFDYYLRYWVEYLIGMERQRNRSKM